MNITERAVINIRRNIGKTATLLGLVFLLGTVVASAIIINQTVYRTVDHLRRSVPTIITLGIDDDASVEQMTLKPIKSELILEIGELPYVQDFDYSIGGHMFSSLHSHHPEDIIGVEGAEIQFGRDEINSFFWLTGVSNTEIIHIEYGLFELVDGRTFTELELLSYDLSDPIPIIISNEVAQINDLSVGTILNLYSERFSLPKDADVPEGGFTDLDDDEIVWHPYNRSGLESYEFVVIGIVDIDLQAASNIQHLQMQQVIYNVFFIPNQSAEMIRKNMFESQLEWLAVFNPGEELTLEEWMGDVNAFWILDDPLYMDSFKEEAMSILPDYVIFEDFVHIFDPLHQAMIPISQITNQILWFVSLAMVVVLGLLITLYLHDRRHELGIYLALGEKKFKIILQILLELMSVALVGFSLAILVGNLIAPQVSQRFLVHELTQGFSTSESSWMPHPETGTLIRVHPENELPSNIEFSGMSRELTVDEITNLFVVSLDRSIIVVFYAIGIITVIISSIVPTIYVLKLNPKELLMQSKLG